MSGFLFDKTINNIYKKILEIRNHCEQMCLQELDYEFIRIGVLWSFNIITDNLNLKDEQVLREI